MRCLIVKFCQLQSDDERDMSRSLSRIRNLVSEIGEIQRQGQQGAKPHTDRTQPSVISTTAENPSLKTEPASQPAAPYLASANQKGDAASPASSIDPFKDLENLVDLDTKRGPSAGAVSEGKVFLQLSGHVSVSLQIEDSGEIVELKQVGSMIEIRFADGKAFHIPFKAVA